MRTFRQLDSDARAGCGACYFGGSLDLRGDVLVSSPFEAIVIAVGQERSANARAIHARFRVVFAKTPGIALVHEEDAAAFANEHSSWIVQGIGPVLINHLQRAPGVAAVGASLHNDIILGVVAEVGASFGKGQERAVFCGHQRRNTISGITVLTTEEDILNCGSAALLKEPPDSAQ